MGEKLLEILLDEKIPCMKNGEQIDDTDRLILELLCQDARRTLADIGGRIGLSQSAAQRRIARLEKLGVIRGYTTLVDHAKLGHPLEAFVELRFTGSTRVNEISGIADSIPEVQDVFTIAGDPDAMAWIRVRDVEDLKRVVDRLRASGRITGTKTLMVLGSVSQQPPGSTRNPTRTRSRPAIS